MLRCLQGLRRLPECRIREGSLRRPNRNLDSALAGPERSGSNLGNRDDPYGCRHQCRGADPDDAARGRNRGGTPEIRDGHQRLRVSPAGQHLCAYPKPEGREGDSGAGKLRLLLAIESLLSLSVSLLSLAIAACRLLLAISIAACDLQLQLTLAACDCCLQLPP